MRAFVNILASTHSICVGMKVRLSNALLAEFYACLVRILPAGPRLRRHQRLLFQQETNQSYKKVIIDYFILSLLHEFSLKPHIYFRLICICAYFKFSFMVCGVYMTTLMDQFFE